MAEVNQIDDKFKIHYKTQQLLIGEAAKKRIIETNIEHKRALARERTRRYREREKHRRIEENTIEQKRALATERSRRYREKMKHRQVEETNVEQKRAMNREYSKRYREKEKSKQEEKDLEIKRAMATERTRRYREKKRLHVLTSVFNVIPEPSRLAEEPNKPPYNTFIKDSSAHVQFHKQFTQNEFGHPCPICDRLWFKDDLKPLTEEGVQFVRTFLPDFDNAVCFTCRASIQKKFIPKMAVYNGFKYPSMPDLPPLDVMSERLISPKTPFKQIRRLRQVEGRVYGQVINVPVEVDTMITSLPRGIVDHCVDVNPCLKLVNKSAVDQWLQYLKNTPLYRMYNITIHQFDNCQSVGGSLENIPIGESLLAQQHTLVWNDELYTAAENLLFEEQAEELSFPSIYLGQLRQFREGVTVTPFMIATSELRRSDRRGVTPLHLLYMAMKIMRMRMRDSLTVAHKVVGKKTKITKEEIQCEDYIHSNLPFLRSIPNSSWYWSERKLDLLAMIKQLGKPTVFFTITANEVHWPELLQLLHRLSNNVSVTKQEISQLHYMAKSTLVNQDPVTCAIYFNKLINVVMSVLQSKPCSPFRKYRVTNYFRRIEFAQGGSPHAHIWAWLDNVPESYDAVVELVDTLISVDAGEASGYIELQRGGVFLPCKSTMVLEPMKKSEEGFSDYRLRYNRLNLEEDYEDMDEFYKRNGISSEEDYRNVIRAGIGEATVLVKRQPSEKNYKPFNPFILNIVQAPMNFQFIVDERACAAYVAEYISKSRGTSHLRQIINADITKNLVNQTEITTQEAAWYLLREPLSKTSVIIEYISTEWPVERQRTRKSLRELSELDDNTDVWKENWFDRYEKRPPSMNDITLAQFVSRYTENKRKQFVQREEARVIRYRNYDMRTELSEYKREMVTLHWPFRNEETEILEEMKFVGVYDGNEDVILERRKEFESDVDIDKFVQVCEELCDGDCN